MDNDELALKVGRAVLEMPEDCVLRRGWGGSWMFANKRLGYDIGYYENILDALGREVTVWRPIWEQD